MKNTLSFLLFFFSLPVLFAQTNIVGGGGECKVDGDPDLNTALADASLNTCWLAVDTTQGDVYQFHPNDPLGERWDLLVSGGGASTNVTTGAGNPTISGSENEGDIYVNITDPTNPVSYVFDVDTSNWVQLNAANVEDDHLGTHDQTFTGNRTVDAENYHYRWDFTNLDFDSYPFLINGPSNRIGIYAEDGQGYMSWISNNHYADFWTGDGLNNIASKTRADKIDFGNISDSTYINADKLFLNIHNLVTDNTNTQATAIDPVTGEIELVDVGGGSNSTVYFDNVAALLDATLDVGDIAITKGFSAVGDGGGTTFYVQTDTLAGYVTDSIAIIPVSGGFAVINQVVSIEPFGGYINDNLSDQSAVNKLISFTSSKGIDIFVLEEDEGKIILEDGLGFQLNALFNEVKLRGKNTKVEFINSTTGVLENPIFLNAKTNNISIDGFDINAQFSEMVNYYSDNLTPNGFQGFNQQSGSVNIVGEDLHFIGSGFSSSLAPVSFPFIQGEAYEIRFNADTLQNSTFSTVYTLPQVTNRPNISLGYNQFELLATSTGNSKIYYVNSNGVKSYYSSLELYRIDSVALSKEWIIDASLVNSRSMIIVSTKSTQQKDMGGIFISNTIIKNYPYTAINTGSSNSEVKFRQLVSKNLSCFLSASAMKVSGCVNASITGGSFSQLRDLGFTGGVKMISFSNDVSSSVEPMNVKVNGVNFRYTGAYGTPLFFSGATSGIVSNIKIDKSGYYIDEDGIEQHYHENDPDYIDPAGGSIVSKVDPVLFNKKSSWLFSNITTTNTNDTTGVFIPTFFIANGAHNVKVSDSNFDGFTISVESSEAPISGGNGGSAAGFVELDNCKISPYEGGNLVLTVSPRTKFKDCYFFYDVPIDASQIGYSRWRFPNNNYFSNRNPITINVQDGAVFDNCTFENTAVNVKTDRVGTTSFSSCKFYGNGQIYITRPLVQPYDIDHTISIKNTKAAVGFAFRSGLTLSKDLLSTEGLKIDINDSDIFVIQEAANGYNETFFKHPGLTLNNVRFYSRTDTYNATYDLTEHIETTSIKELPVLLTVDKNRQYQSNYKITDWSSDLNLSIDSLVAFQKGRLINIYDSTGETNKQINISFSGKEIEGIGDTLFIYNKPNFNLTFETIGDGKVRVLNLLTKENIKPKFIEGTGTPLSVVTPDFKGQFYQDNTTLGSEIIWISTGLTNTDWIALN